MEKNQSISTDVTTVLGEYLESLTEINTVEAHKIAEKFLSVSYTHLTLPTILLV